MTLQLQSKPTLYHAVQYTGAHDLPAIQAFLQPHSPSYQHADNPKDAVLLVNVRDADSEARWPSLGKQYKPVVVPLGSYLLTQAEGGEGDVIVVSAAELTERYDVLSMSGMTLAVGAAAEEWQPGESRRVTESVVTVPRGVDARLPAHAGRSPDDVDACNR